MYKFLDDRLIIRKGDITQIKFDAIVNAANSSLLGGGGVDGAIHRKGGSDILDECRDIRQHRYPDGLPEGKAVVTTGGNLPSANVIHTVGPVWQGGQNSEGDILAQAYRNSLQLAVDSGFMSIAFPAISTGIYGFPKEIAAGIVYKTIKDFFEKNSLPVQVSLVFLTEEDMNLFISSVPELSQ